MDVRLQAITLANIVEMIFFQFLRKEQLLRELLGGLMIFYDEFMFNYGTPKISPAKQASCPPMVEIFLPLATLTKLSYD